MPYSGIHRIDNGLDALALHSAGHNGDILITLLAGLLRHCFMGKAGVQKQKENQGVEKDR